MTTNLRIDTDILPVELTTAQGYNDFVKSPQCDKRYSTVFPDNEANGYVLVNDEIVAIVSGDAKADLFDYSKAGYYLEDSKDSQTRNSSVTEPLQTLLGA
ncbi:hypothetical protein WICPIJ_006472 [Wickerhamomyces pijperi]|uniref:Uncharacterized protein n=1 Tax=Wickerhamomyces pijperi TaxID=599730 RepID=A0A9P8Q3N0_WICPI|nr:hypothetical protein WICPIJ_006472 [Wickerhamomyces pijperi]